MSPNSPDFLAQKLGLDTLTATDSCQIPLSQIHSKDRLLFDNGFNDVLLNRKVNKPTVLSPDKLCFPQRTVGGNFAMGFECKPNTALDSKTGKFEPVCRQLGVSLFKADDITAKDNGIVFVLGGLSPFLLSLVSAACFAAGWLSFRGRLSTGLAVICARSSHRHRPPRSSAWSSPGSSVPAGAAA